MKLWKITYAAIGLALAAASLATAEYGLSKINRNLYRDALSLDEKMQKSGFTDFSLKDINVRFYDGDCDYVAQTDAQNHITINKEKAILDVFAGTTVEADGQWQVLIPTYEQFSRLFDALGALDSYERGMQEESFAFSKSDYSTSSHIASIWHEAFHAWQAANWPENMETLQNQAESGSVETDGNAREEIIVNEVDSDKELSGLFTEEMQFLEKARQTDRLEEKKSLVSKALDIADRRRTKLSKAAEAMEYFLENYEGSARYVESAAYRELEGEPAWKETYLSEFQYENGSGKYYDMGMLKCVLLDQLSEGWQKKFSEGIGLDQLLGLLSTP